MIQLVASVERTGQLLGVVLEPGPMDAAADARVRADPLALRGLGAQAARLAQALADEHVSAVTLALVVFRPAGVAQRGQWRRYPARLHCRVVCRRGIGYAFPPAIVIDSEEVPRVVS